jgi:exonuclease SbcC
LLNQLLETLKTVSENRLKQQNNLENLQSKIDELTEKLDDYINFPLEHWQSKLTKLQQDLSKLAELEAGLVDQKNALANLQNELESAKEQKAQLKETYDRLQAEHQQLTEQLNNLKAQIPEKYDSEEVLESEIAHIEDQIQVLDIAKERAKKELSVQESALNAHKSALNTMSQTLEERKTNLTHKLEQWKNALEKSPFASMQAFESALLTEQNQKAILDEITIHDERKSSLRGSIQALAPKLEKQSPPDLEEINEKLEKANEDYSLAETELNDANHRLKGLTKAQDNIKQIRIEIKEFEDEYKTIGTLSEVLSGQGEGKVSLQRFVQGALLDDVLSYASNRLHKMSKGQFELKRKIEAARRGKASGLDLEVLDNHTGRCRDVATLSGGESFMAALSLALGLSDVVQNYSGGIRLETLFIDEGFGSLDPDALEEVIEVFEHLQSNGRTIGIISHVTELKQQMGKRIDVVKQHNGSSLQLIA